jgi:hypothetical protein
LPVPRDPPLDPQGFGFGLGWALILLPFGLGVLLLASTLRALFGALPWTLLWLTGFFLGGGTGWLLAAIGLWDATAARSWAVGGGCGMIVFSGLRGIATAWLSWAIRHEVSPYPGFAEQSVEDELYRREFARRLRMPALLATVVAGSVPASFLITWGTADLSVWLYLLGWAAAGALGLAAEGVIMGAALGWVRQRDPILALRSSLGEALGQRLAGQSTGLAGAFGWAVGYGLYQLPVGATVGFVVGLVTWLVL